MLQEANDPSKKSTKMTDSTNHDEDDVVIDDSNDRNSSSDIHVPAVALSDNITSSSIISTSEDRIVEAIYQDVMESMCRDLASNMHQLIKTGAGGVIPSSWKLFTGTKVPTRRELYPELYNGGESNGKEHHDGKITDTLPKKAMTDDEINSLLDKYAVDLPPKGTSSLTSRKRRKRDMAEEEEKRLLLSKIQKEKESNYKDSDDEEEDKSNDEEDEDDEDFKMEDANEEGDEATNKTKQRGRSMSTSSDPRGSPPPTTDEAPDAAKSNTSSSSKLDIWGKCPAKEPKNRLCRCRLCGRLISTSRFASHLDKCMGLSTSRTGGGSALNGSGVMTKAALMGIGNGGTVTKKTKRGSTMK